MTTDAGTTTAPGYVAGQCTAYVASLVSWVPNNWGNASEWLANAQAAGYSTSLSPSPGAIAVWGPNKGGAQSDGHVALVTAVQPGGLPSVSEMNWSNGPGVPDTRNVTSASAAGIIGYIYGPPGTTVPASVSTLAAQEQGTDAGPFVSAPFGLGGVLDDILSGFEVLAGSVLMLVGLWLVLGSPGKGIAKDAAEVAVPGLAAGKVVSTAVKGKRRQAAQGRAADAAQSRQAQSAAQLQERRQRAAEAVQERGRAREQGRQDRWDMFTEREGNKDRRIRNARRAKARKMASRYAMPKRQPTVVPDASGVPF